MGLSVQIWWSNILQITLTGMKSAAAVLSESKFLKQRHQSLLKQYLGSLLALKTQHVFNQTDGMLSVCICVDYEKFVKYMLNYRDMDVVTSTSKVKI